MLVGGIVDPRPVVGGVCDLHAIGRVCLDIRGLPLY